MKASGRNVSLESKVSTRDKEAVEFTYHSVCEIFLLLGTAIRMVD